MKWALIEIGLVYGLVISMVIYALADLSGRCT